MQGLMRPHDLHLPKRFTSWRPQQLEVALEASTRQERFQCINAPPGFGKSPAYMGAVVSVGIQRASRGLDTLAVVLTATRALQDQLMGEFSEMGMCDIRGRGNFACDAVGAGGEHSGWGMAGLTAAEAPCTDGQGCSLKDGGCGYYDHLERPPKMALCLEGGRRVTLIVTNYAKWMVDPGVFRAPDVLVLDEAHNASELLTSMCGTVVRIDEWGMEALGADETLATWREWGRHQETRCKEALRGSYGLSMEQIKALRHQRDVAAKVRRAPNDTIVRQGPHGVRFDPVWARGAAERMLFRGAKRVIVCSATINGSDMERLEVDAADTHWQWVKEAFDVRRRPVIYATRGMVALSHKSSDDDLTQWVRYLDSWVTARPGVKVLIQPHSYHLTRVYCDRTSHRDRVVSHDRASGVAGAVEEYRRRVDSPILVSPSVAEGVGFAHDECRLNIFGKVPWPDTRDEVVAARDKDDPWYIRDTVARRVTQMCGRGVRGHSDWCENVAADGGWGRFKHQYGDRWAPWFRESFRNYADVRDVPRPSFDQ